MACGQARLAVARRRAVAEAQRKRFEATGLPAAGLPTSPQEDEEGGDFQELNEEGEETSQEELGPGIASESEEDVPALPTRGTESEENEFFLCSGE